MKYNVEIKFRNGNIIRDEAKVDFYGGIKICNNMTLIPAQGILYREKGNVICGEDITDTVESIQIEILY